MITQKNLLNYFDTKLKFLKKGFISNTDSNDRDEIQSQIKTLDTKIAKLENYLTVCGHKDVANAQRDAYNNQRKNKEILKQCILIEADYKQKISIGLSPRRVNKEYYNQENSLRTCLGKIFIKIN